MFKDNFADNFQGTQKCLIWDPLIVILRVCVCLPFLKLLHPPPQFPMCGWIVGNYMPFNTPRVVAKSLFVTLLPSLMDFLSGSLLKAAHT